MNNYWLEKDDPDLWSMTIPKFEIELKAKLSGEPEIEEEGICGLYKPLSITIGNTFGEASDVPQNIMNWLTSVYGIDGQTPIDETSKTEVVLQRGDKNWNLTAWPQHIGVGQDEIEVILRFDTARRK